MPLDAFSISRLHCFRSEAQIRVAPITLIYGQNNAGKSTLLRALALLAASIEAPPPPLGNLNLACEAARGASFRELRSWLDSVNALTFGLSFTDQTQGTSRIVFRFMEETDGSHVLRDLEHHGIRSESSLLRISIDPMSHYELVRAGETIAKGPLPFAGIYPLQPIDEGFPKDERDALASIAARLRAFKSSITWLNAVRATVPRRLSIPSRPGERRSDGAWIQEHLARQALESKRELIQEVSELLIQMFDCVLHVDIDGRDGRLRASPGKMQWRVPLADLGEGITQVLPVATLCCMAKRGELGREPILLIEQPEMHLHADAERELASFLSQVARSESQPRLILETHSELLLNALLLEVCEGRLRPDDLALHWVTRESADSESLVRPISIDEKGIPWDFPARAFEQRSELARALFLARRR